MVRDKAITRIVCIKHQFFILLKVNRCRRKFLVANKKKVYFFLRHRKTDTHITVNQKKQFRKWNTTSRNWATYLFLYIFFCYVFCFYCWCCVEYICFFGVYVWIIETVRVFQHSHMHVNKIHFCLKALTSSIWSVKDCRQSSQASKLDASKIRRQVWRRLQANW